MPLVSGGQPAQRRPDAVGLRLLFAQALGGERRELVGQTRDMDQVSSPPWGKNTAAFSGDTRDVRPCSLSGGDANRLNRDDRCDRKRKRRIRVLALHAQLV